MIPLSVVTKSPGETKKLGEVFAREIGASARGASQQRALVVGLVGDLAAGKTTFVQGMMKGFGVSGKVTSPTFVLLKIYAANKKNSAIRRVYHCDFYRLSSRKDIVAAGITEARGDQGSVVVVEWADRIGGFLKKGSLVLSFKHIKKQHRSITFRLL